MNFKPTLAGNVEFASLRYPSLASPKMDGIRALTGHANGTIVSRNLKPIPNLHVQRVAAHFQPFLDGELLTYTDGKLDNFNTTQGKLMSIGGIPDFKFHVFDWWGKTSLPFCARLQQAEHLTSYDLLHKDAIKLVPHVQLHSEAELLLYEEEQLAAGWEGVMLRSPMGEYKCGRSTTREGLLLKLKRFTDTEAIIVGYVERQHNTNTPELNELGQTKRSTAQAGMVGTGTLGALKCQMPSGALFEIGTGFDNDTRAYLWEVRELLLGRQVNFKYQELSQYGIPRFPVYRGLRDDL